MAINDYFIFTGVIVLIVFIVSDLTSKIESINTTCDIRSKKHTDTKERIDAINKQLYNLNQNMFDIQRALKQLGVVDETKKKRILIFDDNDLSAQVLIDTILAVRQDVDFKLVYTLHDADYNMSYYNPHIIFADLKHPNTAGDNVNLGYALYTIYRSQHIKAKFILYSAGDKPIGYRDTFYRKPIRAETIKGLF